MELLPIIFPVVGAGISIGCVALCVGVCIKRRLENLEYRHGDLEQRFISLSNQTMQTVQIQQTHTPPQTQQQQQLPYYMYPPPFQLAQPAQPSGYKVAPPAYQGITVV